jgi:hypothetical protein
MIAIHELINTINDLHGEGEWRPIRNGNKITVITRYQSLNNWPDVDNEQLLIQYLMDGCQVIKY